MGDIQTLTKQLSMLQSYMKWKNGEEFNDYCKLWMSDSQQPQPAQNVQRNVLTSSGPSSVESTLNTRIKREIVDSAEGEIRDEQNNNCDATLVGKEVNPGSEEIALPQKDPLRHHDQGVIYVFFERVEKLIYKSHVYHLDLDKVDGRRFWSCDAKTPEWSGCGAILVQAPNGRVILVEKHLHQTPGLAVSCKRGSDNRDENMEHDNFTFPSNFKRKLSESQDDIDEEQINKDLHFQGTLNSSNKLKGQETKSKSIKLKKNKKIKTGDITQTPMQLDAKTKNVAACRHFAHGVSYMPASNGGKLVYDSFVYRLNKKKGPLHWSCDCKRKEHGECKAELEQALDGSIISVEGHDHPRADLTISKKHGCPVYRKGIGKYSKVDLKVVNFLENRRHLVHGVSYMRKQSSRNEKLVYKTEVYRLLEENDGFRYWSCGSKKRKRGDCMAKLVQASDGRVVSVEEHVHS